MIEQYLTQLQVDVALGVLLGLTLLLLIANIKKKYYKKSSFEEVRTLRLRLQEVAKENIQSQYDLLTVIDKFLKRIEDGIE